MLNKWYLQALQGSNGTHLIYILYIRLWHYDLNVSHEYIYEKQYFNLLYVWVWYIAMAILIPNFKNSEEVSNLVNI